MVVRGKTLVQKTLFLSASLKISLAASLLGVLAVLLLVPVVGLWGAVASLGAVQGLTLLLSLRALRRSGCIARSR